MLVLSRKVGEKIYVGEHVCVTVVRVGPNSVRLGVDAPDDWTIVRHEIEPKPREECAGESIASQS